MQLGSPNREGLNYVTRFAEPRRLINQPTTNTDRNWYLSISAIRSEKHVTENQYDSLINKTEFP
ncbi:hypothetical protein DYD21_08655 [Rhodohalobacter sp. SW132]|nr:hypothetical protein DYD21_08655 [Rhodohalobacter sp. SW132]